jgi:hypothetical protein
MRSANASPLFYVYSYWKMVGQDSSVDVATHGLDGPEIETRWGRDFLLVQTGLGGPPSLLYNGYQVFPGGKGAGAWC